MPTPEALHLVLLRHGESEWNKEPARFTGWHDCGLSDRGRAEAREAGRQLAADGVGVRVAHTSVLTRAIETLNLALAELDRQWVPVHRHWRLNERHYGGLQGLSKAETLAEHGEELYLKWRRSYDFPPPPADPASPHHPRNDPRYRDVPPDQLPATECLQDVVSRLAPYWHDQIVPDLVSGDPVLVVAHGNSLRALVKHLDGISDTDIAALNIPTGIPLAYRLDPADPCRPLDDPDRVTGLRGRYLGDPETAAKAAQAVANQGRR
jgi:2,3-bisphosphoglycerate-dependent phosphoglycerate mutase